MYCLQILIVLSGTTLGLYFLGLQQLIVPTTLGAIATALTDFDDRLSIRLRNLAYVCVLFFSVSSILDFLHPYKFFFSYIYHCLVLVLFYWGHWGNAMQQ